MKDEKNVRAQLNIRWPAVQLARGTETWQKNDSKGAVDFLRWAVVGLALRDMIMI
jgi:hypothetical protein